jgi:hypothetical protein
MHRPTHRQGFRLVSSRLGLWLVVLMGGLSECVALWRARWQVQSDRAEA